MRDFNFLRLLVNDLLQNENYTLSGIANYTQTPEEIIQDLLISGYSSPILALMRKIIELHRNTYPDVYEKIIKKIITHQTS